MRPSLRRPVSVSAVVLAASLLSLPAAVRSQDAPSASESRAGTVDFLREVRPVLASHCFKCHGPDEKSRKAGLRLDQREGAVRPLKSGDIAIVPGKPDESELVRRIFAKEDDELMPPPSTRHPLSNREKDDLKAWIAEGAKYQPHWAFIPPVRPPLPALPSSGPPPANPIDAFILARVEKEDLQPSREADRMTLVRRLNLDLIGLPPTPEEADAFVHDDRPDAYERLVDQLLASEHYGERWARRWMDLARYADTNGYEKDRVRSIWPWRDWVVRAFNRDEPFDQFTIEQIAGDMLPHATVDQRIATGFHRNTMLNEEGGIDPLEYRFHALVDRVSTTATTWLGLTMGCAQCHTHKFDPIQHREYYAFMAYLDNADEPVMDIPDQHTAARRREIETQIAALEAKLPDLFPPAERITLLTPAPSAVTSDSGAPTERLADGSYRWSGPAPEKDTYTFTFETTQTNIVLLNLDALADDALPHKGPGRADNGNFVLSEITVTEAPLEGSARPIRLTIASATADFEQPGFDVRRAFDGKENTGWAIAGDGAWNINRRATFRFAEPAGYPEGTRFVVRLVQHLGSQHLLGRLRLSLGSDAADRRTLEERRREHFEEQFLAWKKQEADNVRPWSVLRPTSAQSKVPVLTVQPDNSVFVSSDQTKSDMYDLKFSTDLRDITAIRLEVLPDPRLPGGGPGRVYYEGAPGDFFLSTFSVSADGQPVKIRDSSETFAGGRNTTAMAIDDDPQSGWSIDGSQGRRTVAVFNLATPVHDARDLGIRLLFERYFAAGLGRFRISATSDPRPARAQELSDDLQQVLVSGRVPDADEKQALVRAFTAMAPELAPERGKIAQLRKEMPAFVTTLVLQERVPGNPRVTRVHNRGEFLQPTEVVQPALPSFLAALVKKQPRNRLEFARWLVSPANPLTARVIVNRRWQAFFGRGLVRTVQDFGYQGEPPTHPQLLDWLAVEFVDQGWSMKRLDKLIVMSRTYRQSSSATPDLLARDPENLWLARGPRFRVDAELVRDVALRASGLLSSKMGGPSVFPPQLPSITREGTYGPLEWKVSAGEDRYRRGLYTFAKRTAPYATFIAFDAPSGEACVARREVSDTPLQALTLLNDEVFVEAAQALGRKATELPGDASARAIFIFRRCLTRSPASDELQRIVGFYQLQRERLAIGGLDGSTIAGDAGSDVAERAAWTAVARALLNLDETITRG